MGNDSDHLLDLAAREGIHPVGLRTLLSVIHGLSMRRSLQGDGPHIGAPQVVTGLLSSAHERFGILTREVLTHWGLESPSQIGRGVDVLVESGFLERSSDELDDYESLEGTIEWPIPPTPGIRELSSWGAY